MAGHAGDDGDLPAAPAVYHGDEGRPGPVLFTLEVDGELFAVRSAWGGGTRYDWLTGPIEGYGFGSSAPPDLSQEVHRDHIRTFLGMVDPITGSIADD